MTTLRILLAGLCCWLPALAVADESWPPWIGAPFAGDAKAIAEKAKQLQPPAAAEWEVLFQHMTYRFDETGRQQRTLHRVWRCTSQAAVESGGMLEAGWAPWHERKPQLSARVISTSGEEHRLDPALIAEASPQQGGGNVLSDRKLLRAPLPALSIGAVVEQLISWEEERPEFAAGIVEQFVLAGFDPLHKLRITVEAPASLPLKCAVRGGPLQPSRSEMDGRVQYRLELGPVEPIRDLEVLLPADVPRLPSLVVSTGRSWQEVAAAYAAAADKQIDLKSVESLVRETLRGGELREEAARRLVLRVQELVRYTAVAFGESAIIPYAPEQTLARRFGDCKDQSTLLVALLRAAGHPAHLALLRAGSREDLPPDFPGIGRFDHCIVYVPGEPPLWIDPTFSFGQPLSLPIGDQGRLALIARPETTEPIRTPQAPSATNFGRVTRELFVSRSGRGKYLETSESGGSIEAERRANYAASNAAELKKSFEDFAQQSFQTRKLVRLETTDPRDRSQPFRVVFELADALLAEGSQAAMNVAIDPSIIFDRLPEMMLLAPANQATPEQPRDPVTAPRKGPLSLIEPFVREYICRVTPPTGMVVRELPASGTKRWGPAELVTECQREPSGVVVYRARFDAGSGQFSAAEVEAVRKDLGGLSPQGHARS